MKWEGLFGCLDIYARGIIFPKQRKDCPDGSCIVAAVRYLTQRFWIRNAFGYNECVAFSRYRVYAVHDIIREPVNLFLRIPIQKNSPDPISSVFGNQGSMIFGETIRDPYLRVSMIMADSRIHDWSCCHKVPRLGKRPRIGHFVLSASPHEPPKNGFLQFPTLHLIQMDYLSSGGTEKIKNHIW